MCIYSSCYSNLETKPPKTLEVVGVPSLITDMILQSSEVFDHIHSCPGMHVNHGL